jgi:LysM repeat protein
MNSKFVLAFAGVALLHLAFGAVILSGCKSDGQKATGTTTAVAANTTASVPATPPPPAELYEPTRPPPTTPDSPLAMGHLDSGEPLSPSAINSVTPSSGGPVVTYEVKKGDSASSIAKAEKVSLADLLAANKLTSKSVLKVGQTLTIPTNGAAAPATLASPAASGTAGAHTYTVKSGDSLSKIAHANGTTVDALKATNHLTSDTVAIGKVLTLPEKSTPAITPSAASVPVRGGTSTAPVAAGDAGTYTVQSGDSLEKIAGKLGVKTADLMKLNNISDPRKLQANQKLKIPAGAKATAVPTPSTPASLPPPPPAAPSAPTTPPPVAPIQSVEEVPVTPVAQ